MWFYILIYGLNLWPTFSSRWDPGRRTQVSGLILGWAQCQSHHLTGCCSWGTELERHWRWCCEHLNLVGRRDHQMLRVCFSFCQWREHWYYCMINMQGSLCLFSSFCSLLIWLGRAFLVMDFIFLGLDVIFKLGPPLASTTCVEQRRKEAVRNVGWYWNCNDSSS